MDVPKTYYVKGILGIYEQNRVELFKDVFIWAYERSAMRYAAVRQSLGEPDTFRMKYREEIRATIVNIIMSAMPKEEASIKIKKEAKNLPTEDQAEFIEVVETELIGMHEGNFARYRIKPSEFKKWKAIWGDRH